MDQGAQAGKIIPDLRAAAPGQGGRAWEAMLPDWKMVSQASVWACQTLVLRLLCSSTGVTIILPKVLIICEEHKRLLIRFLCLSKVTLTVESEHSKHRTLCPTNAGIQSPPFPPPPRDITKIVFRMIFCWMCLMKTNWLL